MLPFSIFCTRRLQAGWWELKCKNAVKTGLLTRQWLRQIVFCTASQSIIIYFLTYFSFFLHSFSRYTKRKAILAPHTGIKMPRGNLQVSAALAVTFCLNNWHSEDQTQHACRKDNTWKIFLTSCFIRTHLPCQLRMGQPYRLQHGKAQQ